MSSLSTSASTTQDSSLTIFSIPTTFGSDEDATAIPQVSTTLSTSALQTTITPRPSYRCAHPKVVVLELSTAVAVEYSIFYAQTPVDSFQPKYRSYSDGSLLAPPFVEDLFDANIVLLLLGIIAAVFVRNILTSCDYIRRGRVKNKTLFYLLFSSQLLGPVSLIPAITSHFWNGINCTAVVMVSYLGAMVSLGILFTGILGLKAYRVLENPRVLPVILFLLQAGSTGVVIVDLVGIRGVNRLTGSCLPITNINFTRYFVVLQVVQALTICLCFFYAAFKSRRNTAAQGRISLRHSTNDLEIDMPPGWEKRQDPQGRGWWDYVPRDTAAGTGGPTATGAKGPFSRNIRSFFSRIFGASPPATRPRSSFFSPSIDIKLPSGIQALGGVEDAATYQAPVTNQPRQQRRGDGRHSPTRSTHSNHSGLSRLFPRVELFRQVINNELLYTTFITSSCLLVAISVAISLNFETCLSIIDWVLLNWAFISLLVVHGLGRVVHRHEREACIQQAVIQATGGQRGDRFTNKRQPRRAQPTQVSTSTASIRSRSLRDRYRTDGDDPYGETRPLDKETFAWQFGTIRPPGDSISPFPSIGPSPLVLPENDFPAITRRVANPGQYVSWQSDSSNEYNLGEPEHSATLRHTNQVTRKLTRIPESTPVAF